VRVRARSASGLLALIALLLLSAPAAAQDEQQERPKGVEKVYRDYEDDGVIEACDHTKRALKRTLEELPPEADVDTPDLRPALEAAIEQHEDGDCEEPEPTPTPEPTATPDATATPAPTTAPTPAPDDPVDSGSVDPVPGRGGGGGGGGGPSPPGAEDVKPLAPEITPVPPATTPAPAAPAPAEPSGPAVTPAPVYSNADDGVPLSLLVLAGLLALLALLALLFAAAGRFGWAESRLAGPRRALREATFRAGGTWGDFADWMRLGR
jgi:hypothetical protein